MRYKIVKVEGSKIFAKALDSKMSEVDIDSKAEDMALSRQKLDYLEPSSMQEVVGLLRRYLQRDIPVMLIGSSGFGKSELISRAATSIPNFPVDKDNILDIRAGMLNVEDLRGLPTIVKNDEDYEKIYTHNTLPSWLKKVILKPDKNFVLFFDELNHASAAVLNSVYGIILERRLDEFSFKERTRIVAAGNKDDQNEDLTDLSDPLKRRLEIIDIDKAVDLDSDFFESYLRDKYKDSIPSKFLDILFDPEVKTADARSVERILKAWVLDIKENEPTLTQSVAVPRDLYLQIQKIYAKEIYKPTGSQGHKEVIKQIEDFVAKMKINNPEYFSTERTGSVFLVKDLVAGKLEPKPYDADVAKLIADEAELTAEGVEFIKKNFPDTPEEYVVAALSKKK